ncbi:MAG: amidohydrolase family protein [Rhizobiales bacterium]|nr:amidohydrolase family protein [Hyphomicrobiales bacterium]
MDNSDLVVDCHAHIFTTAMPLRDNPRHRPNYSFTVQDYLAVMDAHGIDRAVLAAASPWADYNDYLIDSVKDNPRLRGTVLLEPSVERYTLDFMKRDGIVGVRMHMIGLEKIPDLSSFEYRRMLHRIADQGWHVHLHCEGRDLPDLLPHFTDIGMKLVIDHLGRPDPVGGINSDGFKAMLRTLENGHTWVKASGHHRLGAPSTGYLQELIKHTGGEKLVWGSDCPFVGEEETIYQSTLDWLLNAVPNEHIRKRILGLNAQELYFQ